MALVGAVGLALTLGGSAAAMAVRSAMESARGWLILHGLGGTVGSIVAGGLVGAAFGAVEGFAMGWPSRSPRRPPAAATASVSGTRCPGQGSERPAGSYSALPARRSPSPAAPCADRSGRPQGPHPHQLPHRHPGGCESATPISFPPGTQFRVVAREYSPVTGHHIQVEELRPIADIDEFLRDLLPPG